MPSRAPAAALLLALAACRHHPDPSAGRPGRDRMELLDGRLAFTPPAGATLSPYRASIMSAPASSAEESRVLLVPGQPYARFVLNATELFATLDGDAAARRAAVAAWAGADLRLADVTLADGATAVEYVTTDAPHDGPLLVYGAVVAMPDHTAVALDYYILPSDAADRAAWADTARALTRTVTRGARPLPLAARTETFDGLAIDRPAGFTFTTQPGPDFTVYHLRRVGPLAAPPAVIGLYVGGHPSLQHSQSDTDAPVTTTAGTLLSSPTDWHTWSASSLTWREAIAPLSDHLFLHAFHHSTPADAPALAAIVATLRRAPAE